MWSTSTGGATGASVPGSSDAVILDAATCVGGVTCTITVNTTVAVQSITMGACTASTTGCILDFSTNNNNVTLSGIGGFSGTGTGTRTLNMGNGTWSVTEASGGNTLWNLAVVTNLTFNANSSTILFTNTGTAVPAFVSGVGLTYNTISLGANTSRGGVFFSLAASTTFTTLNVSAPNNIAFTSSVTITITNALNLVGTASNPIRFGSVTFGNQTTISTASGAATFDYVGIDSIAFTGGATFTATNSFNLGKNTGITITGPSTSGGHIIGGGL